MHAPPQHRLSHDALAFVVTHFLPHLNRDAIYRILKAEGLNRLPPAEQHRKPHGTFKDHEVGFVHVDVKHLPKLQDRDRLTRKRYLYVAIDRASRHVHLAVKDDETTASVVAFLAEALVAFFWVTHVLTDRGSCFTAEAFEAACQRRSVQHCKTRPYTPPTNEMVERFNGQVQREVLSITLYSHADLETVLGGFNAAYNGRRQRVLDRLSPEMVPRQRLEADPALANPTYKPPGPSLIKRTLRIVADAKEVSHLNRPRTDDVRDRRVNREQDAISRIGGPLRAGAISGRTR